MNTEETTILKKQVQFAIDALTDIRDWTTPMNDQGNRASHGLQNIYAWGVALGGRSIQSEGPSDSECVGDRPKATPNPEFISVEALEKEPGWEKGIRRGNSLVFRKYSIAIEINVSSGDFWLGIEAVECKGVSTMQELRTLEVYVNGPRQLKKHEKANI